MGDKPNRDSKSESLGCLTKQQLIILCVTVGLLLLSVAIIVPAVLLTRKTDLSFTTGGDMLDFLVESGDISKRDGLLATWFHRANGKEEMNKGYRRHSARIRNAQSEAHPHHGPPSSVTSDNTLDQWLDAVLESRKGIKLDFKSLASVGLSLDLLLQKNRTRGIHRPVWLNADILKDPLVPGFIPIVNGTQFLELVQEKFPDVTLSLGWMPPCRVVSDWWTQVLGIYNRAMMDEMFEVVKDLPQKVTFPIQSLFIRKGWPHISWLLSQSSRFSLTLWQGSQHPSVDDLLFVRDNSHPARVYYDIYEPTLSMFKQAVGKIYEPTLSMFKQAVGKIYEPTLSMFKQAVGKIYEPTLSMFKQAVGKIYEPTLSMFKQAVGKIYEPTLSMFKQAVGKIYEPTLSMFKQAVGEIYEPTLVMFKQAVGKIYQPTLSMFKQAVGEIYEPTLVMFKQAVGKIYEPTLSMFKQAVGKIYEPTLSMFKQALEEQGRLRRFYPGGDLLDFLFGPHTERFERDRSVIVPLVTVTDHDSLSAALQDRAGGMLAVRVGADSRRPGVPVVAPELETGGHSSDALTLEAVLEELSLHQRSPWGVYLRLTSPQLLEASLSSCCTSTAPTDSTDQCGSGWSRRSPTALRSEFVPTGSSCFLTALSSLTSCPVRACSRDCADVSLPVSSTTCPPTLSSDHMSSAAWTTAGLTGTDTYDVILETEQSSTELTQLLQRQRINSGPGLETRHSQVQVWRHVTVRSRSGDTSQSGPGLETRHSQVQVWRHVTVRSRSGDMSQSGPGLETCHSQVQVWRQSSQVQVETRHSQVQSGDTPQSGPGGDTSQSGPGGDTSQSGHSGDMSQSGPGLETRTVSSRWRHAQSVQVETRHSQVQVETVTVRSRSGDTSQSGPGLETHHSQVQVETRRSQVQVETRHSQVQVWRHATVRSRSGDTSQSGPGHVTVGPGETRRSQVQSRDMSQSGPVWRHRSRSGDMSQSVQVWRHVTVRSRSETRHSQVQVWRHSSQVQVWRHVTAGPGLETRHSQVQSGDTSQSGPGLETRHSQVQVWRHVTVRSRSGDTSQSGPGLETRHSQVQV
ncbi:hypothetical protein WMY93_000085 [Mugilogobius chulae]|uniref:Protein FAM151A n=1 Tax=Mugilogobius chulae TaxID=88201 RepID=A0AAW0Q180_9GOBI